MFSSLLPRFQIPPRCARPPFQKGAFGSPPLSKEGQGGFRQQYPLLLALTSTTASAPPPLSSRYRTRPHRAPAHAGPQRSYLSNHKRERKPSAPRLPR